MPLSERLSSIKAQYISASHVWDVGCDHGELGLSFNDVPTVQAIHLVDPSKPVIDELHKKTKDSYISKENLLIHHQRGQEISLCSDVSNHIFIAGMGGKEIGLILKSLRPQLNENDLVTISPHRGILELRRDLHASEFRCLREFVIEEGNQFYQILTLNQSSQSPAVSLYGKELWKGEVGEKYRLHQLEHFNRHKDSLSQGFIAYLRDIL